MNLEERIYLIKELDIQRAQKKQKVDHLTREVIVLSATVKQLTTPKESLIRFIKCVTSKPNWVQRQAEFPRIL